VSHITVAAVQHDIAWEDPEANFARLAPMLEQAEAAGARLALLSEMYATGFSMAADRIAEPPDGPSATFLHEQATRLGVWIGGSVPELPAGAARPCNQFVLAAPDGTVHRYAKIHPFSFAGEHDHYAPGDKVVTVDIEGCRVTPFVCYDLRFADGFWGAAPDTDLYVVVANWPASRRLHWTALLQARAIENQAYVAGVNRVGKGDGLDYAGDSRIIDPLGEVLTSAAMVETVLLASVDTEVVADVRARFPFLHDR
jgi:predicted amidohydrolase